MKFIKYFVFFAALAFISAACQKDDPGTVTFKTYSEVDFTIAPNTILDIPAILTPGVSTNWQADFSNYNTNKDKIKEMKLNDLTLTIKNPPGKTFKFLQSIKVYIEADGLAETLIAHIDNIPETVGQTIEMTTVDTDIAPYAKKDNFRLRINVKPDEYNPDYVDVNSQMHFKITADVID